MSLRPLDDKVAIIPIEDPDVRPSGLWIPDQAKQRADQGIIKYRGPNVKHLRVGMHVLFSPYSGTKITHVEEGTLFIMPEDAVEALISEDPPMPIFPLHTVERVMRDRASEWRTKHDYSVEEFVADVIDRLTYLPTSEGFEF